MVLFEPQYTLPPNGCEQSNPKPHPGAGCWGLHRLIGRRRGREGHLHLAYGVDTKQNSFWFYCDGEDMLGRVTKYRVNNDAPSEVFEAATEQEREVWADASGVIVAGLRRLTLFAVARSCARSGRTCAHVDSPLPSTYGISEA